MGSIKRYLCIACNEDGYGPSAFAYYLVKAIAGLWADKYQTKYDLTVYVFNNSAFAFNQAIYDSPGSIVCPVKLAEDSLIRLEKKNGEVSVTGTLNILKQYRPHRQKYLNAIQPYLEKCNAAVDIGVPLIVRSASILKVPHRITLFDHSWAETLRMICSKTGDGLNRDGNSPSEADRRLAEEISASIEEDEACASEVWLFDRYITPDVFRNHWNRLISPDKPENLKGVLGSRNDPKKAWELLNKHLVDLGEEPVPNPAIKGNPKLVLISPGGTPVWEEWIPGWIDDLISHSSPEYIPVFSNPMAADQKQTLNIKNKMRQSGYVRWFEFIKGSTQQIVLPAFDLIVTRAGGGTVNDALAARVPFACIEEEQDQVKQIEEACFECGLISEKGIKLSDFKTEPVRYMERFFKNRNVCMDAIRQIKTGAETKLAERILTLLDEFN
jgi:hypothetical protein